MNIQIENNKTVVNIKELRLWDKNPRQITVDGFERLKKQLSKYKAKYGDWLYKPLLCTPSGEILGGNMRFRALKELGAELVWISVINVKTEQEKVEIALSDNDRAGKYDFEMLDNLLSEVPHLKLEDYSVDLGEPVVLTQLGEYAGAGEEENNNESESSQKTFEIIVVCNSQKEKTKTIKQLEEDGYTVK